MSTKNYVMAVYDSEAKILAAATAAREKGLKIHDVYTPFAVHGMDEAMGLRRSRLPWVTFLAGLAGLTLAFGFQTWVSGVDWPVNVGGKPFISYPAWIPVTFELTVLIGGLSTVLALFLRAKIGPGAKARLVNPRVTDDRFVIAIDRDGRGDDEIKSLLNGTGAIEIMESGV